MEIGVRTARTRPFGRILTWHACAAPTRPKGPPVRPDAAAAEDHMGCAESIDFGNDQEQPDPRASCRGGRRSCVRTPAAGWYLSAKQTWRTPGKKPAVILWAMASAPAASPGRGSPVRRRHCSVALFRHGSAGILGHWPHVATAVRRGLRRGRAVGDQRRTDGAFDGLPPNTQLVTVALRQRAAGPHQESTRGALVFSRASSAPATIHAQAEPHAPFIFGAQSVICRRRDGPGVLFQTSPSSPYGCATRLSRRASHCGWAHVAIVYDASNAWAPDAARQFGARLAGPRHDFGRRMFAVLHDDDGRRGRVVLATRRAET